MFKRFGLLNAIIGAAVLGAVLTPAAVPAQGSYYGQRATQDRDYSRMQSATQRAYGKTTKVTLQKKKKKKKKATPKHKHRHKH
jgi:hypothetical protein